MGKYAEQSVGELVATVPGRARFFEKIGVDYCCGGKKPLSEACAAAKRDLAVVEAALEEFDRVIPQSAEPDWTTAPLEQLIDHIVTKHHGFLKDELPRLSYLVNKVADRHGDSHPELRRLHTLFEVFRITLTGHLASEENVLFPAIKELARNNAALPLHGETKQTITVLIKEHDLAGADLLEMRQLTNNFVPPADACVSYSAMLEGLEALERDLHQHVHKENNILFPRASSIASKKAA